MLCWVGVWWGGCWQPTGLLDWPDGLKQAESRREAGRNSFAAGTCAAECMFSMQHTASILHTDMCAYLMCALYSSCLATHPALQVFSEADFETFMRNDDEILRSAHARWMLLSERDPTCDTADATSTIEAKGLYIEQAPLAIGSAAPAAAAGNGNGNASGVPDLAVAGAGVAAEHARVWRDEAGDCWVQDLPSSSGTWVNGKLLKKGDKARLLPQVCVCVCV